VAVVLDSDAVVGFLDRSDALHEPAASEINGLIRAQRLVVSVVTYAEVLTGARLGHHDEAQVRGFFSQLISAVLPVDMVVADTATDLRSSLRSLRMPDALVLATAETESDVDLLVTGDRHLARITGLSFTVKLLG
jgi:predicted nucleic acid-binding protein